MTADTKAGDEPRAAQDIYEQLRPLFYPRSVAVVGVSQDTWKPGSSMLRALLRFGFQGRLYPISARGGRADGAGGLPVCRVAARGRRPGLSLRSRPGLAFGGAGVPGERGAGYRRLHRRIRRDRYGSGQGPGSRTAKRVRRQFPHGGTELPGRVLAGRRRDPAPRRGIPARERRRGLHRPERGAVGGFRPSRAQLRLLLEQGDQLRERSRRQRSRPAGIHGRRPGDKRHRHVLGGNAGWSKVRATSCAGSPPRSR